jgi:hypothetical protein
MMIKVFIVLNKLILLFGLLLVAVPARAQQPEGNFFSYFINSNPFNAEVYYKDSLLGLTPIRFGSGEKLKGVLTIKKQGYKTETYNLEEYNFQKGVEITLNSVLPSEEKIVIKDKSINFVKKKNFFGIIGSGLLSLAAGTLAYTTKEKANDLYNSYLTDRNQDNLDKSNRYDIYSGVSLALMQVSVAALVYFLFLK